jgi:hypothetical protein
MVLTGSQHRKPCHYEEPDEVAIGDEPEQQSVHKLSLMLKGLETLFPWANVCIC